MRGNRMLLTKLMSFWESYFQKRGKKKMQTKNEGGIFTVADHLSCALCGRGGDDELVTLFTFKKLRRGWARPLITIIMALACGLRNHGKLVNIRISVKSSKKHMLNWRRWLRNLLSLCRLFRWQKTLSSSHDYDLNFYLFIIFVESAEEGLGLHVPTQR